MNSRGSYIGLTTSSCGSFFARGGSGNLCIKGVDKAKCALRDDCCKGKMMESLGNRREKS